jgi:predicted dehydrogenase
MKNQQSNGKIDRRRFLHSTAATSARLAISQFFFSQTLAADSSIDDINLALIGAGAQGHKLMELICLRQIPGIRVKAICDIWTEFNQRKTSLLLQRYKHTHNVYEDYRQMLDKEKDNLDAVIVATPDFWHLRHTVACLEAGLHVYCEAEMANTADDAKVMVETAKRTGKLLQIGRQRRSNPRYISCYERLIKEAELLGRITTVNGQWNRSRRSCEDRGWPSRYAIDDATLNKYEFESMHQFRNWQWYKGKGGGQIVACGSHQIDIYSWFLEANPKSIIASGGTDYWKGRDWYDNVMAIYEYQTKKGTVRAFYQTITTNDSEYYYEKFLGIEGTLVISEHSWGNKAERQWWVEPEKWEPWIKKGYLKSSAPPKKVSESGIEIIPDPSLPSPPPSYDIPVSWEYKPYHLLHLENFFDAIRGKAVLSCPGEIGYKTAVTVLKANKAVQAGRKLEFQPDEFAV